MKALFSLLLLCLFATSGPLLAKTPGEVDVGAALREVNLQGLTGQPRKLSSYRGKPLIINVWASWCGPCRMEMGSLERLNRRYGGKQFNLIGISTDDYPDAAKNFLSQVKPSFNHYIDKQLELENMLGADRLPLTLLVDGQGKVLAKFYGAKEWDSPEALAAIGRAFQIRF
jgi:thiol-disulfide isomerase/thioredoxin